jgi:ATP-dependent helicase/nuclease subunit A
MEKSTDEKPQKLPEFITGTGAYESAKRGIATHNFMQFFDVGSFLENGAEKELERLGKNGFISPENAKKVRLPEIELFRKSDLYREMREAKKLYREFRFSAMLPAEKFTENPEKKALLTGEKILAQGVIDCIIEDSLGRLHLVDYKTDRLTEEELSDSSLAEKTLSEKHSLQLYYYSLAIEKIFGKRPETVRVYSLPLGDTVDIDCNR